MGLRTAGRLAVKLRKRVARTAVVRSNARRKRNDLDTAPVVVEHTVVTAVVPPPPPRTFIGKVDRPPPPQLRSFVSHGTQAPNLQLRTPLHSVIKKPPTTSRRKAKKPKREPRPQSRWEGYGTVHELRSLLGLTGKRDQLACNSVLVAIDCEWERLGLVQYVVEVGITTLRIGDIAELDPGDYIRNWTAKMQHCHVVIDITRKPRERMSSSLFGKSLFLSPGEAKATILSTLRACMANSPLSESAASTRSERFEAKDEGTPSQLILIGQSVGGDIMALNGRPLHLDIPGSDSANTQEGDIRFSKAFDTLSFTERARRLGVPLPSAKLGPVVRALGVDPDYLDSSVLGTVKGTHNAVNDAAYSMWAALLYAVKWDRLTESEALQPAFNDLCERREDRHQQQQEASEVERPPRSRRKVRSRRPTLGALRELAVTLGLLCAGTGVAQMLQIFAP